MEQLTIVFEHYSKPKIIKTIEWNEDLKNQIFPIVAYQQAYDFDETKRVNVFDTETNQFIAQLWEDGRIRYIEEQMDNGDRCSSYGNTEGILINKINLEKSSLGYGTNNISFLLILNKCEKLDDLSIDAEIIDIRISGCQNFECDFQIGVEYFKHVSIVMEKGEILSPSLKKAISNCLLVKNWYERRLSDVEDSTITFKGDIEANKEFIQELIESSQGTKCFVSIDESKIY